jgi:hypothetical protein
MWNGVATKWIVGVCVGLALFSTTGFIGFVLGHDKKPGHDVMVERVHGIQADLSKGLGTQEELAEDVGEIKIEQREQRIILNGIAETLNGD